MKKLRILIIVLPGFFAGCAGYNTTMFMTKSNAGLDIDMKPPTAEINISRKEAVIEPVFEKGQTPPVMASFKPNVHFGGALGNYFLGVDQTFAGGDAAQTMSILYGSPTPPFVAGDESKFNSEINLETPITSSNRFVAPAPPGVIRPFIFATDTSLGLKVAWSGAGGQFPDTIKAGFNRKEFAWAPLTMSKDSKSVKMPSFLATIESKIGGGSTTNKSSRTNVTTKVSSGGVSSITNVMNLSDQNGGIQSMQYFATGKAATYLARQYDVRTAMLARLDPNEGKRKAQFIKASTQEGRTAIIRSMQGLYAGLKLQTDDPVAQAFVVRMDQEGAKLLNEILPAVTSLKHYEFVLNTLTVKANTLSDTNPNNFYKAIRLWSNLGHSAMAVKEAMAANKPNQKILFQPTPPPASPTPPIAPIATNEEAELFDQSAELQRQFDLLDEALRTNEIFVEAADHYVKTVMPH